MSHWEKVESQVTNLDTLQAACEELGATVRRNAVARGYSRAKANTTYGKDKNADMVISIGEGQYDIAVTLDPETGVYGMEAESAAYHLKKAFQKGGHRFGKILEMYSVHQAEDICRKKRKSFDRVVHKDRIDVEVYV